MDNSYGQNSQPPRNVFLPASSQQNMTNLQNPQVTSTQYANVHLGLNSQASVTMPVPNESCASGRTLAGVGLTLVYEHMWKYVRVVPGDNNESVDQCPICISDCIPGSHDPTETVVELNRCKHKVHLHCLNEMLKNDVRSTLQQSLYIKCPYCKTIYGEQRGNQPPGTMNWTMINNALPGFPNTGTIQITYQIFPGVQGIEHPNPGEPYSASNFPRTCYLPDTEKGRLVRDLLKVAFDRRLIFTVGRSLTTHRDNVVTWNDINHKTEWNDYSGHGYPDANYLDRCLQQLANFGVTPEVLNGSPM